MANKVLKQWIQEKLHDPSFGSHQEVRLGSTRKKADYAVKYPDGKVILIEDKESGDSGIEAARKQIFEYKEILKAEGYSDFIEIVVKDLGNQVKVEQYRNGKFESDVLKTLKTYELQLGTRPIVDISTDIYQYIGQINQMLHENFVIRNLVDRMIFTGVVLVASKYSNGCFENYAGIEGFKQCVVQRLNSRFTREELKSKKINDLTKSFLNVAIGTNPNDSVISKLCEICKKVNQIITDNPLSNIDIMNIFFIEFNRYRAKNEHGQVFTPDHIANLMANILNIRKNDKILDPTCGSGSLLIKASGLLSRIPGSDKRCWKNIFGNDFDRNVLFLSYINMLLHNDGVTNLENYDCLDLNFGRWVKNNKITKVIANPPYESTNAIDILNVVLENVLNGCVVCWLMPNTKMEKIKKAKAILNKHTLTDIILLPDIFAGVGTGDVSLFMFKAGTPQNNKKINGWWIPDDGFESVKNQGYKDVNQKWEMIKQKFLERWESKKFDKEIDPKFSLSFPKNNTSRTVTKEDFELTLLQFMLFKKGFISSKNTVQSTLKLLLKSRCKIPNLSEPNTSNWKEFQLSDIFFNEKNKKYSKIPAEGNVPFVSSTSVNNGIAKNCNLQPNQRCAITVSTNGACFDCFWHNYDFCASTDVEILTPKVALTDNQALFICAALQVNKGVYGYGNKPKNGIVWKTKIKLPCTNGDVPDYKYMEKYMDGSF